MISAPYPDNELQRLAALARYGVLDTEREPLFDDLASLAAQLCDTPMALISLVDGDRQWCKAGIGIDACDSPRELAFCAHAILGREIFEVPDAASDPRFADHPLVTGDPYLRFYAGAPLITADGYALGTLCLLDRRPRTLSTPQRAGLAALARQVVGRLELRLQTDRLTRSLAEQRRSEVIQSRLQFGFEHALDGMALLDADGRFLSVNPALAEIFGFTRAELTGQPWTQLYAPEWVQKITTVFFPQLHQQGRWHGETVARKKTGEAVSIETALALCPGESDDHGILWTCRDQTAHKATQDEILRARARLQAVLDAATEFSIIATDLNGLITVFNRGAEWMLAYDAAEMIGLQTPAMLHRPDEMEARARALSDELGRPIDGFAVFTEPVQFGTYDEREWTYVRKDGQLIPVTLLITAMRDANGVITGYLGIAKNITEKKAAEQALAQAADELAGRNTELQQARDRALAATKAKTEFLASMSHELRTPMNAIIGMAEMLQETALSPLQQDYVDRFSRAAGNLLDLINDILDISKIEAGRMDIESIPFDLHDLVDKTTESMAIRAFAKAVDLIVFVHPDVPATVQGDPTRLRQVLFNLIGNAVKFTERGHVMVTIEPTDRSMTALRVAIADTGIGIPADKIDTIFDSFTQVDSSTTRKYGGTGLGLSISKRMVELMGGRILVESVVGQGSTFSFTLPSIAAADSASPTEPPPLNLRGRRILVVAPCDRQRLIIRSHLARLGAEIVECPDGAAALRCVEEAHQQGAGFDLALVECLLRDQHGMQLVHRLRARAETAALPIVIIVSEARRAAVRRDDRLQITGYLYKPLSRKRLLTCVAETFAVAPPAPVVSAPTATAPASRPTLSILLVEDVEDNRDLIALFLKDQPYRLDMADNGAVGVAKFQAGQYDLVLMDIQMPVMDGYQATSLLRAWEREHRRPTTPIVALTANAFKDDVDKSLAAGCTAHLTKPIKKQTLLDAIDTHRRTRMEPAA